MIKFQKRVQVALVIGSLVIGSLWQTPAARADSVNTDVSKPQSDTKAAALSGQISQQRQRPLNGHITGTGTPQTDAAPAKKGLKGTVDDSNQPLQAQQPETQNSNENVNEPELKVETATTSTSFKKRKGGNNQTGKNENGGVNEPNGDNNQSGSNN